MRISLVQQKPRYLYKPGECPDLPFLKKMSDKTMDDCFVMLKEAADRKSELAVTIEAINTHLQFFDLRYRFEDIYEGLDGPLVERFSRFAREHAMHIIAGLILSIDGKAYNCGVLFDDRGVIAGVYKKVHLPAGEELQITAGDNFEVYDTKLGKIGILICYDMHYPESARELSLMGAELIACPTWGWEGIYGPARAYENGVCIAAAMGINHDTGMDAINMPSCLVDNMGNIVCSAGRSGSELVTGDIDIHAEPPAQYGSDRYIDSKSMRKTRLLTRRPDAYKLATVPTKETPLYKRYFPDS